MIRPFGLNDIWLVRRLQRRGMTLAVEHMLTHPHEPLWTALTAPWPWAGVGVATFVLDETLPRPGGPGQRLQGFAQLLKRASRPEAELLHVAPAVMSEESSLNPAGDDVPRDAMGYDRSAEAVWSRLLAHCSFAAATHGLQRVYASTPEGCYEQTSLKQAGFCLYTRETIYRLATVPKAAPLPKNLRSQGIRAQHPRDSWALQRLYTRSTPRLVQQAEGALSGGAGGSDPGSPLLSWWEPDDWQGWVLEPAGEVRGVIQVHRGRAGHWLRVLGSGELSAREVRLLVEQGLRSLDKAAPFQNGRHSPVYVTVRDYEMNLSGALVSFGFAPLMERARFVKHTTAVVRIAEPVPAAVRELAREVAAHSQSIAEGSSNAGRQRRSL
ncbi:MAG: hypothetical protein ACM3VW_08695 [Bacteroidota bacterium]